MDEFESPAYRSAEHESMLEPSTYAGPERRISTQPYAGPERRGAEELYADGEHESMLTYLSHMHHETLGQTVARLEAALAYAKANLSEFLAPLATRTEAVTREVTITPEAKASVVAPANPGTAYIVGENGPESMRVSSNDPAAYGVEPEPFKP